MTKKGKVTGKCSLSHRQNFRSSKTDLNLSFTKETIGFYFQRAILAVDSLCSDGSELPVTDTIASCVFKMALMATFCQRSIPF